MTKKKRRISTITYVVEGICAFLIYGAVGAIEMETATLATGLTLIAIYLIVGAAAHGLRRCL